MPFQRGDRKLHITFNEMGHGDNILISLPNGKMVMIDCGSMRWDRNFWRARPSVEQLRAYAFNTALGSEKYLLNNKQIDLLILSHPDKDHCVELDSLFNSPVTYNNRNLGSPTKAVQCFYSNDFGEYDKHGVCGALWGTGKADNIYSVTINATRSRYGLLNYDHGEVIDYTAPYGNFVASADGRAEVLRLSRVAGTRNFVKVLDGTAPRRAGRDNADVVDCGFYILASNVEAYAGLSDNSPEDNNRNSIVTAVVYGDKKFLFLADATFHTERFLMEKYGDLIEDVEVVQIGHHASHTTSSSYPGHPEHHDLDFVGHVNPRYAVITAAWDAGQQLGLPRYETIARYHAGARMLYKPNNVGNNMKLISCYEKQQIRLDVGGGDPDERPTKIRRVEVNVQRDFPATKHVWCTGSHGAVDFDYGVVAGQVERVTA